MNFMNDNQQATSVITFVLMILVWWNTTGSIYLAGGMIILLLIHELGHYYAAKTEGIPVMPPVFTPFGAFILTPGHANARQEAFVAIAGPLAGTAAALITLVAGLVMRNSLLIQLAHWGFLLNLFNMIPISPLDGGRISMAIERRLWIIGAPLLVLAFFQFGVNGYNLLFFAFIAMQCYQDYQQREEQAYYDPRYFNVGSPTRIRYAIAYLSLAAFLAWVYFVPGDLLRLLIGFGL